MGWSFEAALVPARLGPKGATHSLSRNPRSTRLQKWEFSRIFTKTDDKSIDFARYILTRLTSLGKDALN